MNTGVKRYQQEDKFNFYKKDILSIISKVIIELSPIVDLDRLSAIGAIVLGMQRKFHLEENVFSKHSYASNPHLYMTKEEFKKWLHNSLMDIKDFRELNLSFNERMNGVDVDDPDRGSFVFHSIYDIDDENSWKDDFIDLDACIGNIFWELKRILEDTDCFLCVHSETEDSLECINCTNNPKLRNNYYCENKPFGDDVMRWCSNPCGGSKAVCCYDCDNSNECKSRCCGSYFTDGNITCSGLVHREVTE